MNAEKLIKWIADAFGTPCDYVIGGDSIDEYMFENDHDWCQEHCGHVSDEECWLKYFELKGIV